MGTLYYGKKSVSVYSATSEAAGYVATNLGREELARPWRSTSLGTNDVGLEFPANGALAAILLTDCNFTQCSVLKSAVGYGVSEVSVTAAAPTAADKIIDRRRVLIVVGDANVKAVRINVPAGSSTDGAGFWRIGAAYAFSSAIALPRQADFGARVRGMYAQASHELPNLNTARYVSGSDRLSLMLPFDRDYSQDVWEIVRRGRQGTVCLDLSIANYGSIPLPVRHFAGSAEESLAEYNRSKLDMELTERA